VEAVSETASASTWTGRVWMYAGRPLPDLDALARDIVAFRVGARLRGVEATLEGELVADDTALYLRRAGSGEEVRLVPLVHKVQWDVARGIEEASSPRERAAHERLRDAAGSPGQPRRLRVIGPLMEETPAAGKYLLEVRDFEWQP
jgi:hypothetical protein